MLKKNLAALLVFFCLLPVCPAFAESSLERAGGTWLCMAEETMARNKDLDAQIKDPKRREQSLLLLGFISFTIDAPRKRITVAAADDKKTVTFRVLSEEKDKLVILTDEVEEIHFEFKGDSTMISHGKDLTLVFRRKGG